MSCGDCFTLVLDDMGQCWSFGKGSHGRLGNGSDENSPIPIHIKGLRDVRRISAGCRHSSAITKSGELYVWGFNFYNQLGLGDIDRDVDKPLKVNPAMFKNHPIRDVSCGYFHTSALVQE